MSAILFCFHDRFIYFLVYSFIIILQTQTHTVHFLSHAACLTVPVCQKHAELCDAQAVDAGAHFKEAGGLVRHVLADLLARHSEGAQAVMARAPVAEHRARRRWVLEADLQNDISDLRAHPEVQAERRQVLQLREACAELLQADVADAVAVREVQAQ